jgi:hypothetical protein
MSRFDLYKSPGMNFVETAEALARSLGIEFVMHESDYIGGDYFLGRAPMADAEVQVVPNYVDDEGYRLEPEVETSDVLVYISGEPGAVERLAVALPTSVQLVRSEGGLA